MKFLYTFIALSTLPTSFVYGDIVLGNPSVTLESLYQDLREEDGRNRSDHSRILRLDTLAAFKGNIDEWDHDFFGTAIVELNLVFEDGEEVQGSMALSYVAFESEERFSKGYSRLFTLSAERIEGVVENIVAVHEEDFDKTVVRVDLVTAGIRFGERTDSFGVVAEGSIGFERGYVKFGIAALGGDKLSLEVSGDATREAGGVFSKKSERPNYSLLGIEGKLTYYFTNQLQVQAFVRSEQLVDYDSDYDETILSSGARLKYFFTRR